MSKCPYCEGPDGPKHLCREKAASLRKAEPRPNWSWQEKPPSAEEVKAVAQEALNKAPKPTKGKVVRVGKGLLPLEEAPRRKKAKPIQRKPLPPAHPECARCAALNVRAADRMRKLRASE